ncbi:hypothetical protein SAY86_029355 [Trapa natans]|uniref:Uncharacterized protein n=1 Tax=Trapa natans TaxID=22666 RepID=A0AAN7R9J1_TRANT|nr:hypothetical protein SAY86_029355 [Trapa natans]
MQDSHHMLSARKPREDFLRARDELIQPLKIDDTASPIPKLSDLIPSSSRPDFSIRNFVLAARRKDISINWPFSQKSLQFCQKHDVEDPLPPFQSLHDVRKQPSQGSMVKTNRSSKKDFERRKPTKDQLRLADNEDDNSMTNGLTGNNLPSTTASIPSNMQSNNESTSYRQPQNFLAPSVEKEPLGFTISTNTETLATAKPVGKKDQMIVKLGDREQSLTGDIYSTSAAVSEMMASKVCPVCKTFSSSSNTTLNAHIDQCLYEEPAAKWSAGSKQVRRRIKPRKTRLMVDIYETPRQSNLVDLDQRNCSNGVTGTRFTSRDTANKKKQGVSFIQDGDSGAVYVDSNGTKLRILSKLIDSQPSSSGILEALRPRKCYKGRGKGVLLFKKKRNNKKRQKTHNHPKCQKLVSPGKDFPSDKTPLLGSQLKIKAKMDFSGQKRHKARAGSKGTCLFVSKSLQPSDQKTLKRWACSKRSSAPKRVASKDQHPPLECTLHSVQDMLVEPAQCSENNIISDGHDSYSSEDPTSSEKIGAPVTEGRERKLSPLFHGRADCDVGKYIFPLAKRRASQSSDPFKSTRGWGFHDRNKIFVSSIAYDNSSKSHTTSPAEDVRSSGVEKKVPPVCLLKRSKLDDAKGLSIPQWSQMHLVEDMNEDYQYDDLDPSSRAKTTDEMFLYGRRTGDFEHDIRKISAFQKLQDSLSNDESTKLDGFDSVMNAGQGHESKGDDNIVPFQVQHKYGHEDNVSNFSKYLNQGNPVEYRRIHTPSSIERYKGSLGPTESRSSPGIIEEDNGDGTNQPCSDVNLDADAHMKEYETERILIPGPPGSFLPSPGAMGLEEFQGNSFLSTSRVQAFREDRDLVSRDSSDFPISVPLSVSKSAHTGSENNFLGSQLLEEGPSSAFSSAWCGIESLTISNVALISQHPSVGFLSEQKSFERGTLNLNNEQPCCCERKLRGSQGVITNYLEPQLLRRNPDTVSLIAVGNHQHPSSNTTHFQWEETHQMQNIYSEMKSWSSVPVTSKGFNDIGENISDYGNSVAFAPPVSNPVFRLMGRDLVVVNKEDDSSTPPRLFQSSSGTCGNSSQAAGTASLSYGSTPIPLTGYSVARDNRYRDDTLHLPNQPLKDNSAVVSESQVSRSMKQVIIIDDDIQANNVRQGLVSTERQASVKPVPPLAMRTSVSYDPRLASNLPFTYSLQDPYFYGPIPVSRQAGSSDIRIPCYASPEGPGAFQPVIATPAQGVHFRPPLPYSSSQ